MLAQLLPTWLGVFFIVVFLGMVVVGIAGVIYEIWCELKRRWDGI